MPSEKASTRVELHIWVAGPIATPQRKSGGKTTEPFEAWVGRNWRSSPARGVDIGKGTLHFDTQSRDAILGRDGNRRARTEVGMAAQPGDQKVSGQAPLRGACRRRPAFAEAELRRLEAAIRADEARARRDEADALLIEARTELVHLEAERVEGEIARQPEEERALQLANAESETRILGSLMVLILVLTAIAMPAILVALGLPGHAETSSDVWHWLIRLARHP